MSLGPFGTINLAARALQTQQEALEITGQNLANVTNPAYARQRVLIASSPTVPTAIGPQGTGVEAVAIQQIRDALMDVQIQSETSTTNYLQTMQSALQYLQTNLGQVIDRQAQGADGASSVAGVGQLGLAEYISDLFNAFQSLSTNPTSMADRQILMLKASSLTTQFNQLATRLGNLSDSIDAALQDDVSTANQLLADIADLNGKITVVELGTNVTANDLRDQRQAKLEELARYASVDTAAQPDGSVTVSIGGVTMVAGNRVSDTLETYNAGGGQLLVRAATATTTLDTGGSIQARIDVRDGALKSLSDDLDSLAATLITTVNAVHKDGYSLTGSSDADFFTGSDAATIGVNSALVDNPALIQASGASGAVGDNQVALALAQLADAPQDALGGLTFGQSYAQGVARMGQTLASTNSQLSTQQVVQNMLTKQRNSISGVSIDEEMTNLTVFQRAYQANARLISVVDELLMTLVNLGKG
jgi:flagellar hook-associated protein 1 FlgK